MKPKRIFCLILAFLMSFSFVLSGCTKETEMVPHEPDTTCYFSDPRDLGGHTFRFLVRSSENARLDCNEVFAAELNGDKVNDAVFKRNSRLGQDHNCKIEEERVESPVETARDALLAGEYKWDFIYANVSTMRSLAYKHLLADLNTLKSIDLDRIWYDQEARKGFDVMGKLFMITGDCGTMDKRAAIVMLYNKTLLEENGREDLCELVEKGEWTVAKMVEIMKACAKDVDGDGVWERDSEDIFGYAGEGGSNWAHVAACNAPLSGYDDNGSIMIPDTVNGKVSEAWAELKPLLTSPLRLVSDKTVYLQDNRVAFYSIHADIILKMVDTTVDFGIIPMPKLNAKQEEYRTTVLPSFISGYMIPVTASFSADAEENGFENGLEQAAYFFEKFTEASRNTLTVAFFDQLFRKQATPDPRSGEMLELCFWNKLYDPVALYGWGSLYRIFQDAGSGANMEGPIYGTDEYYDTLDLLYEQRVSNARKALEAFATGYIDEE